MNLSIAYERNNELEKAMQSIDIALDAALRVWPNGHANRVIYSNQRGNVALKLRRFQEATKSFRDSLEHIRYLQSTGAVGELPRLQGAAEKGLFEARSSQN